MHNELDLQFLGNLNSKISGDKNSPPVFSPYGLSHSKICEIQDQLGFEFPADFYLFLSYLDDPETIFFDWKNFNLTNYNESINWIISGIEFDVEYNELWLKRWGEKPKSLTEAKNIMRSDFLTWPKLLPIYGHRFLPAEPCKIGNPVFSIYQTDIIYFGSNLAVYLIREFSKNTEVNIDDDLYTYVPIWSDFAELTDGFQIRE